MVPGQVTTLSAAVRTTAGETVTGRTPTWSTSDGGVATVSPTGMVTGVSTGTTTVTARVEGAKADAEVEVVAGGMALPDGSTITVGRVTLRFPAGAVTTPTTITISPDASPPDPASLIDDTAFRLGPDGTTFAKPVIVEIGYDAADLPAGAVATDLSVRRWTGTAWEPLADHVADGAARTVAGATSAFSRFAIVYEEGPPTWRRITGHPGEGWSARWGD